MMIHAGTQKVEIVPLDSYRKEHFKGVGSFKYFATKFNTQTAQNNYLRISSLPNSAGLPTTPTIPNTQNTTTPSSPTLPLTPSTANHLISLESSRLDAVGKQFFQEREISLKGDSTSQLKKGESRIFTLEISKSNGDRFNGILKQPIILVANSTNITIEPVAISLVKDGKVEIKLTANQNGPVYTAINMGTNRM